MLGSHPEIVDLQGKDKIILKKGEKKVPYSFFVDSKGLDLGLYKASLSIAPTAVNLDEGVLAIIQGVSAGVSLNVNNQSGEENSDVVAQNIIIDLDKLVEANALSFDKSSYFIGSKSQISWEVSNISERDLADLTIFADVYYENRLVKTIEKKIDILDVGEVKKFQEEYLDD